MTKNILVIPGGFVPYNDTVTLLSYKHLRSLNAKMDVIALKGKEDEGLTQSLKEDENFKKFNIEYFGYYDDTVATYERKNVVSCFFNFIKYCFYAKNKAKEKKYDVVYTSSIPSFTHLSGYFIKKMLKDDIVWIASFSDPLYKSPYKKDLESFKEYNIIQKVGFFVYIWIYMNGMYEKIAQKYADKVLYICKEQKEFMISHYPNQEELNKKAMVIPLNYIKDWSIYKDLLIKNKIKNEKKIISHFGRIYGLRKIDLVLHAIKELKEEIPNLSEKLVFEQYGQILDRYVNMIEELNIGDVFKCFDKISYNDVMDKMHKSDALALYDTFVKEDEMQPYLPSKSLEYLLLKKDLLILAQKNSPTYRIFNSYGYKCTDNDVNSIKERIKEILYSDNGYRDYDISTLENEVATKPLQEYINTL